VRLPRDVSGERLVRALRVFGYMQTRQVGSHVRLTTHQNGEHHVTVPLHESIRIGTLSGILTDVGDHLGMTRDEVVDRLSL
jgi:predicted RNA binding protein YcfA (HicA-like mRNA interferase family)